MLVTHIRYGRTVNLGNFQSEKLEVEIIPEAGQTAEQALEEVRQYVDSKTSPNAKGAAPPPTTDPPLKKAANKAAAKADDPPKPAAPKKPRAKKKAAHEIELGYTVEAQSLEELHERFENLRTMGPLFGEGWEVAVAQIVARYRALNSVTADPEIQARLTDAFKEERRVINAALEGAPA
jgi:hypothetical protein